MFAEMYLLIMSGCLLTGCLLLQSAGAEKQRNPCLFVSRLNGKDSNKCGRRGNPCKTLKQALRLVRDGGTICLDGRTTQLHPYGCEVDRSEETRKFITKNITIQAGKFSKAYLSCNHNLNFRATTNHLQKIKLSGLVFVGNGVNFVVRHMSVVITDCTFINCSTAIKVQQPFIVSKDVAVTITNSEFWNNSACMNVRVTAHLKLTIARCRFQGNDVDVGRAERCARHAPSVETATAAVEVLVAPLFFSSFLSLFVTDSIFKDVTWANGYFALRATMDSALGDMTANLSVLNTSFVNNNNGIRVSGDFVVQLTDVVFNSTCLQAIAAQPVYPINTLLKQAISGLTVSLERCVLVNNGFGVVMGGEACEDDPKIMCGGHLRLVVKDSLFLRSTPTAGSASGIKMSAENFMKNVAELRSSGYRLFVLLDNVTFAHLQNYALYIFAAKNGKGEISVKNCNFIENNNEVYRVERSTVFINLENDKTNGRMCRENRTKQHRFMVVFEDCTFEGNVGYSGALYLSSGNITITNCTFEDNVGVSLAGHVFMKDGFGSLRIQRSTFLQTSLETRYRTTHRGLTDATFLYSESSGPLSIESTSFHASVSGYIYPMFAVVGSSSIKLDTSASIRCPFGSQIRLENNTRRIETTSKTEKCWTNITYMKFFCEECRKGFYSLQRGSSNGLEIQEKTKCLLCPYGATCTHGHVAAKDNFWGFNVSTNPPSLHFIPCPLVYCTSPNHSSHYVSNGCRGNRSGVLCGQCKEDFTETMYSKSCRKNENCTDHWFWLVNVAYVLGLALFLVFKPPIFPLLYRQSLWFKSSPVDATGHAPHHEDRDHKDGGYLKIVFYFYQIAELVMIKDPEDVIHMIHFVRPVISLFNFQVESINNNLGCPFSGLTVVAKELFKALKVLGTMASVAVIYGFHRAIGKATNILRPSLTLYLAVTMETLLLGYETLADTTLKLLHCVPVALEWRLFVDGNVACWQWWQYLLVAFIVVFVVPFTMVLLWGSLMLYEDRVSAWEVLAACAVPLPFLVVWIVRVVKKTNGNNREDLARDDDNGDEVKKILHEPFRPASDGNNGAVYWEGVLIARRLVLLAIHTFATDPTLRFVCLDCACVAILIHHLIMEPFRNRIAQAFETLSLTSLVALATFNLIEATFVSSGIEPIGSPESLLHALEWIEVGLLGFFPSVVCVLVAFCAISQLVRLLYNFAILLWYVLRKLANRWTSPRPFFGDYSAVFSDATETDEDRGPYHDN